MADTAVLEPPVLGGTFQHFVDFLRETDTPAPLLSPKRFSQALHIDLQMLAEQAHVHRNTITRAHRRHVGCGTSCARLCASSRQ